MTFRKCIEGKVKAGTLTKEQADEVLNLYREYEQHYSTRGSADWARAKAAESTIERKTADLARKKRLTNLRILRTKAINEQMSAHSKGMVHGAMGIMTRDIWNEAKGSNVEYQHKIVRGQLHAMLDKAIERMRPKGLGLRQETASLRMWVRALYGEKVSDPDVADMAKAYGETAEYAKQRFNAGGGMIGDREDWRLPNPRHDKRAIKAAGFKSWHDFVLPRLDRDRMQDHATGLPLSDEKLGELLQETYRAIVTGGWSRREPGSIGGKALANRRAESRFLTFKTADDWLAYNDTYGTRDIFDTLMGHVDGMAMDIGLIEVMGPSPNAMLGYMQDVIRKTAAEKGDAIPSLGIQHLGHTYDVAAGRLTGEELSPVMTLFTDVRNVLTSAQLGSAFISAVSDIGFVRMASKMSGMPTSRVLGRYLKLMNPANAADRVLATRLQLIAENANSVALAQRRYTGEILGGRWSHKLADVVMRGSLLSPHTQSMKWAFGMELLGFLGDHAGRSMDELPGELAGTLQRYGIDSATWDAIRTAERHPQGFLWPEKMPSQETHDRLMQMVMEETALAVPEADARTRAITTMGTKANSILGQAMRSVAMYKAFPISVVTGHIYRGLAQRGGWKKGAYLAEFFALTTIFGALSMQLGSIAKGKDPQDPTDKDKAAAFWGAAVLKGGGLGIFGDFLFSETNRFGGGLPATLAGPVVTLGGDILSATVTNAVEFAQGKTTNMPREMLNLFEANTPGHNLWYARLAFERMLFDQIELMIDPKAPKRLREMQRKTQKDYGQKFWWAPGEIAPKRAPDLAQGVGR